MASLCVCARVPAPVSPAPPTPAAAKCEHTRYRFQEDCNDDVAVVVVACGGHEERGVGGCCGSWQRRERESEHDGGGGDNDEGLVSETMLGWHTHTHARTYTR